MVFVYIQLLGLNYDSGQELRDRSSINTNLGTEHLAVYRLDFLDGVAHRVEGQLNGKGEWRGCQNCQSVKVSPMKR